MNLQPLTTEERFAQKEEGQTKRLRADVEAARKLQQKRFEGKDIPFNAAIPGGSVTDYCQFTPESLEHFKKVIDENTLSTRSMDRLAKVARTVADLDGSKSLEPSHLDKAATFVIGTSLRESFS